MAYAKELASFCSSTPCRMIIACSCGAHLVDHRRPRLQPQDRGAVVGVDAGQRLDGVLPHRIEGVSQHLVLEQPSGFPREMVLAQLRAHEALKPCALT